MYSKSSRIVILVFAILVIGFFIVRTYSNLGGAKPLDISIIEDGPYLIYGEEYVGSYNSKEMESLFFRMKEMTLSDSENRTFCIVSNFKESENRTVSYFVGFISKREIEEGTELQEKRLDFNSAISIELDMHNSVMPLPEDVDREMTSFARNRSISLANYTVEKYVNDDLLIITRPILVNN